MTSVMQGQTQDMKTELRYQNNALDKVTDDIDATNTRMIQVDNNMKRLMQKANQGMCWGVLCCEIALLLVFIFV